jgi:fructose-1-phosphate kinase PfkB-like protein
MMLEDEIEKAVDEVMDELDSNACVSVSEPRWVVKSFYTQIMRRCRARIMAIMEEEVADGGESFEP